MTRSIDRRGLLSAGVALGASLVMPAARACEFYAPNFTIVHPWTRASMGDATSAIVSMRFEDVQSSDRLIGVQTPVAAGAEMGGEGAGPFVSFVIPEGQTSVLSEAGTHLRLIGLKFPLPVGRTYPITLVFLKAGAIEADLTVDFA